MIAFFFFIRSSLSLAKKNYKRGVQSEGVELGMWGEG